MFKKLRSFEALVIFGLYFLPILLWSIFGFSRMSHTSHWTLFSLGIALACFGGLAIATLTRREKQSLPESREPKPKVEPAPMSPPPPSPDPSLKLEIEKLEQQMESLKKSHSDTLELKASEILNLKDELVERQKELKSQKELAQELESKIEELEYEIKTLVDFNRDADLEESLTLTESDATRVLKKWMEAAAKLGGGSDNKTGENLSQTDPRGTKRAYFSL